MPPSCSASSSGAARAASPPARAASPDSARRSRSATTRTSPRRRWPSSSTGCPSTSFARCATTSAATRTARPCWRRSSASYRRRVPSTASQVRPSRGDELELTIDSLAHGGNGVARLEGYVVFVAGAVPGDRVRAVVGKSKKAYAEARAIEIVEPSPERIPEFADHPGAPWQVLSYERQLAVKAEQVEDALRRI